MRRRRFAGRAALLAVLALLTGCGVWRAGAEEPRADVRIPAPELPVGLRWLNSPPLTMAQLRGKVVIIDFWEYTCINCIRTFPYLKAWHSKYADKGLVILGVHTPEFKFARSADNVARGAKEFGLLYPLINDADQQVWKAYGNRYWPAKYLIDAKGNVRYYHFGEGGYRASELKIQALLREINPAVQLPEVETPVRTSDREGAVCYPVTPELYLGHERGVYEGTLANREGYQPGKTIAYKDPGRWEDGLVYFNGRWTNHPEAMISTRPKSPGQDYVAIRYHALGVNAVLRPEQGKPVTVYVHHDGKPVAKADRGEDIKFDSLGRSYIVVDEPRMYHIIQNAKYGQRNLKLSPMDAGMGIYTFTFVSCEVEKSPVAPVPPP